MFRFIEAEGQTMQSGIKKTHHSQRIFTSSPSNCDDNLTLFFLLIRQNYHRITCLWYTLRIISIKMVNASGYAHQNIPETLASVKSNCMPEN